MEMVDLSEGFNHGRMTRIGTDQAFGGPCAHPRLMN